MDLLDPTGQRLSLRETPDKGVYPENCTEKRVTSIAEVIEVMAEGARNRHVAATRMN